MLASLPSTLSMFPVWAVLGAVTPVQSTMPAGPGLHWVDVGQGSALLIHEPGGGVVAVDSGPSAGAEALVHALARGVHDGPPRVDLWIHTHWDADHVGGFARVVAGVDGAYPSADDPTVDTLWDRGFSSAPATQAALMYAVLAGDRRLDASAGAETTIGDVHVRSLVFDHGSVSEENGRGLALCITLPGLRVFVPGDLPAAVVAAAASACPDADVLWASHHGGADGISPSVVDVVDPELVVVTAGPENPYCHPQPATLALLHDREVWITHASGLAPAGPCEPLAGALGPKHHIAGGGIWLPLDAR